MREHNVTPEQRFYTDVMSALAASWTPRVPRLCRVMSRFQFRVLVAAAVKQGADMRGYRSILLGPVAVVFNWRDAWAAKIPREAFGVARLSVDDITARDGRTEAQS